MYLGRKLDTYIHCCDVEWIQLPQNTVWWAANTILNIREFHKGKLGTSCLAEIFIACVSLRRKAFVHGVSNFVFLSACLFVCFCVCLLAACLSSEVFVCLFVFCLFVWLFSWIGSEANCCLFGLLLCWLFS